MTQETDYIAPEVREWLEAGMPLERLGDLLRAAGSGSTELWRRSWNAVRLAAEDRVYVAVEAYEDALSRLRSAQDLQDAVHNAMWEFTMAARSADKEDSK